MKKFRVNLYFHGCYSVDVEANNESEAREIAEEQTLELNDKEFISEIGIYESDHDVYEL
jgi:hypothetical protein